MELIKAISNNDIEMIKYLIEEKKQNVNKPNSNKFTPLHYACYHGNIEIIKLLFFEKKYNANVNIEEDVYGRTLLHHAIERGYYEITQLVFLKNHLGSKITFTSQMSSPLHFACKKK